MARPLEYGALDFFIEQTDAPNSIISANLRNRAFASIGNTVQVPVINYDGDVTVSKGAHLESTANNVCISTIDSGNVVMGKNSVLTASGELCDVNIGSAGNVTADGQINATGAALVESTDGDVSIGGAVAAGIFAEVTAKSDITVSDTGSVIATDKNVALSAGNNVNINGTVDAKTVASATAANGAVTVGGAVSGDSSTAISGKTGVSGAGAVGKAGSALTVANTTSGGINLTGEVKGTTADFTAEGQSISVAGDANDFTDAVTAKGASVTLKDKNAITLAEVLATAGNVEVTAGGQITATDVEASGNAMLTATDAGIEVASVKAGTESGVATLVAANGAITKSGAGNVTASDLQAAAKSGIDLNTTVASVTAETTDAGNIALNETDAVTLTHVKAASGNVEVTAGGQIAATDVEASGNATLTATDAGIEVTSVKAGTESGVATLVAANGAITKSGAGNVTASDLQAAAKSGIDLNTTVASATADTTDAGDIVLNETDAVTLTHVKAASGNVEVTAGGRDADGDGRRHRSGERESRD